MHDKNAFTEGLFFDNKILYESTGSPEDIKEAKSVIGILNLETGILEEKIEIDKKIYFGEGITKCRNKIYQLTYKNQVGFIYDSKTFKKIGSFNYKNKEGWGLTTMNDSTLIMSDGTDKLTFLDSNKLKIIKELQIVDENLQTSNLNELEYVDGFVYANIFTTPIIVKIDIKTGQVVGKIDFSSLCYEAKTKYSGSLELNGIAYNKFKKTFFVTGKMWPNIYEIKLEN